MPLTDDGNLMKTKEIIKSKRCEFWQSEVTAYAGAAHQGGLKPGSEKINAF